MYKIFFLNTFFRVLFYSQKNVIDSYYKTHEKKRRKNFQRRLETNDLDASPPHEGWRT